ncbi:MAG: aminotransferase class V-fold PLP-dependent enzyme, partial [Chloroflexota bacterium]
MNALGTSHDFPAADKSTYLNAASVALMYAPAEKAITAWQRDLAEYGTINFNEQAEQDIFKALHRATAHLFKAQPEDIAVASSATELLASLAWAIMPAAGSEIISTDVVFPTTVYPWIRVAEYTGAKIRWVSGQGDSIDQGTLIQSINDNTSVVCISHVEFGSGQQYDLSLIAEAAHAHEALLIVDATQSAGAVPIDAPACGADAIISGGYKWLCGPFGVAVMYLAPKLQATLLPGLVGFRSNKDIWNLKVDYIDYPDDASRFEFSTMAYGCAIGLAEVVKYLNDLDVENILAHNLQLADLLLAGLDKLQAEIISPRTGPERTSIVSARFPSKNSKEIVKKLDEAGIVVSPRRDFVRFSPHLYNSSEDIERT